MYALDMTSDHEYEEACNKPLALEPEHKEIIAPHACETIRQHIEKKVGKKRLYTEGLTIKTTLDISAQKHAEDIFTQYINSVRSSIENVDGALVSIDGKTGAVRALIGGYDYATSQFNRAIQARRQMGSIFKPFVFPERIKQGSTFADTEIDEPLHITDDWNPQNVHKRFEGEMTLARALVRSNNIIAIKNILEAGIDNVIDFAEQCHLPGPFPPYPSLALGCTECSTLQAAAAFNVFANKGVYVEPYLIEWVKDTWGDKIWRHKQIPEQVLAWNVSSQILHGLSLVMHHIKKRMPRKWIASECMGKSGTTNKARTCWFVGATPHLTTAIYLGCDDNRPMKGKVYSVATVAPLWLDYNRGLNQNAERFFYHPALQKKYIHEWTGQTIDKNAPNALPILYDPTIQSLDRSTASYNTAGVALR
jgi:penicillin-binding protein 1A